MFYIIYVLHDLFKIRAGGDFQQCSHKNNICIVFLLNGETYFWY